MIRVDDTFNGREASVRIGDVLQVCLSENASTGYQWVIPPELKPKIEKVIRERDQIATGASGPPGKAGSRCFRFEGTAPGIADLEIHYRRPWEKDASPTRTFTLHVRVRPKSEH